MSMAVGNGALEALSKAIGSDKINENAAGIQGIMGVTYGDGPDAVHLVEKSGVDYNSPALIEIHRQISDLQATEKTSGLMFNPETRKLDVPDADETTAGVVKLTHEVSNRDDGEWAVTADGVYAYCPGYKTPPVNVLGLVALNMGGGILKYAQVSNGWLMAWVDSPHASEGDSISIGGYGTPAAQTIAFVLNPPSGTNPVIAVSASNGGGFIDLTLTTTANGNALVFLLPVYKL